jgi:hypothetical protein
MQQFHGIELSSLAAKYLLDFIIDFRMCQKPGTWSRRLIVGTLRLSSLSHLFAQFEWRLEVVHVKAGMVVKMSHRLARYES